LNTSSRFFAPVGYAVVASVLVALGSYVFLGRGVAVIVKNDSGSEMTNLQIKYTDGRKSCPQLPPAKSFKTKVNPDGETSLVVEFVDASGKHHSAEIDVYIEHNYGGSVTITIQPDGKATWINRIKSSNSLGL
jgi:hypothetical protein